MPSWNDVQNEVHQSPSPWDRTRRKYLMELSEHTGRNVIVYYSGWLEKAQVADRLGGGLSVNDSDKNGFMSTVHGLDRAKGLDLFLHTPGGDIAATESLVDYLRSMFPNDIRVVVPQLAMSAGTMIALAANEILMGAHSSLGPIDPQFNGLPAHGIIEEFETAKTEIAANPATGFVWQHILSKYHPTLIGECYKAIEWSKTMVREWLITGMFSGESDPGAAADRVLAELADHALTLSHARHISAERARGLGLNVTALEDDQRLQDLVLSVHHACATTLGETGAFKIIENHNGTAFISAIPDQRA
jgi:hypothetical protein